MYNIVVTHIDSTEGNEVMFDVTVFGDTVVEALEKAHVVRATGLGAAYVEVDQ